MNIQLWPTGGLSNICFMPLVCRKAVMSKGDADKQDEAADGPLIDAATSSAAAAPAAPAAEARNVQIAPAPVNAEVGLA